MLLNAGVASKLYLKLKTPRCFRRLLGGLYSSSDPDYIQSQITNQVFSHSRLPRLARGR